MAASKVVQRILGIRKFRLANEKSGFWKDVDAVSRHPLTLLIIGFALTAIVGGCIQSRQQEIEKERAKVVAAQDAIQNIRQAVAEYAMRGRLLWIRRDRSSDENAKGLSAFDDALVGATKAVSSHTPAILRAMAPDGVITARERGYLGDLSDFLSKSSAPIPSILQMQPTPADPSRPVAWRNPMMDPMEFYMIRLQGCADAYLLPFEGAISHAMTEREEWLERGIKQDAAFYENTKRTNREPDCPFFHYAGN